MVTSPRLSIDNELSPQEASVATLCQVLRCRWPVLFIITSTPRKLPSVCAALSVRLQSYMSCLFPSSHLSHTVHMIVQIAFIHSCIHASILSWIHTFMHTQRTCTYNIESHMVALVTQSLGRLYPSVSIITYHVSSG